LWPVVAAAELVQPPTVAVAAVEAVVAKLKKSPFL
jgi:hypothetical protein